MGINARYVQGNLIFHEAGKLHRWLHAFGPTIRGFRHAGVDWPLITDGLAGWVTTLVEAGAGETTITGAIAELGGGLLITTDANENDGATLCRAGTGFQCAADKPWYFGTRLKVSEATQSDFYVGLSVTSTDPLGGVTDGVAFRKVDGSTSVALVVEKDSTETTAAALTCDTSYHTLELVWDGAALHAYVDDVQLADPALTNLPDDERLTPIVQFLAGSTNAKTMTIAWLAGWQVI